jgi:hypothetical protein
MFMGTNPFITVRARRPLTEIEFCAWVAQALPGDRLEYHRGFLTLDRCQGLSNLTSEERKRLTWLGARAFWAAEQGLVHLVQERTGPDRFAYIAVARRKPKDAAVSLSALLLAEQGQPDQPTDPTGLAAA